MRTTIFTTAALAAMLPTGLAAAAPEGWAPLLAPNDLSAMIEAGEDLRIVQVSGDYAAAHIPGAVSAPYAEWRGPPENPGALRETAEYQALVQSLGITAQTPVVLVHEGASQTDMGTATRVYWTLKSLGVEDLAVLNGGLEAWAAADLPTSNEPVTVAASDYAPELDGEWRVTTEDVRAMVAEGGDGRLIDARPKDFFEGITWSIARPGTISGAGNLTYDVWFEGDAMVGPEAARRIAAEYGRTDAPVTVSFCNTGHWASINWFALSELADVPNTRLYAESMAEWTQSGGALDNAPNRVEYYWRVTRNWISETF